jgi:regulatory protein SWI6
MGTLIQSLSAEFNAEIKTRQDALDVTQAHLRAATRELAEQRKQIQLWQARCSEADQLEHQLRNLDKAVAEEDAFEWTGRADLDARDARLTAPHAFRWSEYASSVPPEPTYPPPLDPSVGDEADIPLPQGNGVETLVRLRRLKIWSARMEGLLEERARRLQGADLLKEFQCRKIVALCTGQPVDKVEQVSGFFGTSVFLRPNVPTAARRFGQVRRERANYRRPQPRARLHAKGATCVRYPLRSADSVAQVRDGII